jgi:hypothetical protein
MHRGRSLAGGYNGMVITDLVNPLAVLPLKATSYTYGAYSGTNVADFLALTDDSVTESIPTSSDITLFGFDVGLWSMQGGNSYCTATSNSTAVADGDYVEIHFEYSYRALFFVFSWDSNGGFDRIQIIRKSAGVVLENQIHETPQQEDQDPQNCIYFDLGLLSPTVCDETIIRLIAPRNADSVTIHDICPLGAYVENKTKYLTIQGDQTVYGPITMGTGGGIVDRMATTAQLTSAAHDINTSTAKRLGYRVYNTTTKTDYIAQGNADNSTWVSTADGTTTITPS